MGRLSPQLSLSLESHTRLLETDPENLSKRGEIHISTGEKKIKESILRGGKILKLCCKNIDRINQKNHI